MKPKPLNRAIRQITGLLTSLSILLCSLAYPTPVHAQGGGSDGHGNYWRHYTTDDGLLSNTVRAVAHTEDPVVDVSIPGLWIGTNAGLNYSDGRNWINYTAANSDLPDDDVRALVGNRRRWVMQTVGLFLCGGSMLRCGFF